MADDRFDPNPEFEVSVTLTFRTVVSFANAKIGVTYDDAIDNFYGYGLLDLIESGEYNVDGMNSLTVCNLDSCPTCGRADA